MVVVGRRVSDRVARVDAERFTGRGQQLARIDTLLAGEEPTVVLLVHGPGGIGKSALLREIGRRAERSGRPVSALDGRALDLLPGQLEAAFAGAAGARRPVVLLDSFERIAAAASLLRERIVPGLTQGALVVIADRRPPDPAWFRDGWEHVTEGLALGPLPDDDARALLARHGLTDRAAADEAAHWAAGSPLALGIAAAARSGTGAPDLGGVTLSRMIAWRLAGDELDEVDAQVLAVAAVAGAVDARLLAAVLPGRPTRTAYRGLRRLSVAEPVGARVTLHDVVRTALREDLRTRDRPWYDELRRRIADHLHDRALAGEPRLMLDLAGLLDDPVLRWGFDGSGGARYRVDRVQAGDEAVAAAALGGSGTEWWQGVRRFLTAAPERVAVVRDAAGALAGLCIAVTPANAPTWADADPILGRWLAHARGAVPDGNALLWRDAYDLLAGRHGNPSSPIVALLNTAANLLCGLPNVRWFYGACEPDNEVAVRLSRSIGAIHLPELDAHDGERIVQCHVLDHGPGGVIGTARLLVYRDLGLAPCSGAARPTEPAVTAALRSFHDPVLLAASPLVPRGADGGVAQRAEAVRALLRHATSEAFGATPAEAQLREVLERAYFDPASQHARHASELHLSRATYFRRLRTARDRLVTALADPEQGDGR